MDFLLGVVSLRLEAVHQLSWGIPLDNRITVVDLGFCPCPSIQHRASFPPPLQTVVAAMSLGTQAAAIGKVLRTKASLPTSQRHDVTSHLWLALPWSGGTYGEGSGGSLRASFISWRSGWGCLPFLLFHTFHFVALVKLRSRNVSFGSFLWFVLIVDINGHVIVWGFGVQLWCGIDVVVASFLQVEQQLNRLRNISIVRGVVVSTCRRGKIKTCSLEIWRKGLVVWWNRATGLWGTPPRFARGLKINRWENLVAFLWEKWGGTCLQTAVSGLISPGGLGLCLPLRQTDTLLHV